MLSALALIFVGCQQDDYMHAEYNRAMSFNVVSPNAHTRVAGGAFESGDKVGIYVTDYISAETPAPLQISGNRANNEAMVYNGTTWNLDRTIYWGDGKSDVYAYYPYVDDVADVDSQPFSIATDQTIEGNYEGSDFLWAKAEGVSKNSNNGAVSLDMKHAMSRLVVKIVAGNEYVGSLPSDATVHIHSTVADALVSLANGSVVKDPYSGAKSIKMRNLGIQTSADGQKAVVYEAIVVPQRLQTSVPLLEINSKSVSYLLEDTFNFRPGTSYTYTAVLNSSTTAIKVEIGCEIEDWNNIGGGSGDGGSGSEGGDDDGIDLSEYIDLSTYGTANCYMIKTAGKYKFKAVQGNSDWSVGNVKKTDVLWETFGTNVMPNVGNLIAEVGYKNGYVYFSTPETFANGNASIAVRNSKDVILWSWHIWCTEEGWNDHVYANNAGIMMDRNLGATSATPGDVGALGLLYQWGRKDPFLGACTTSGNTLAASTGSWNIISGQQTIGYAEENPMTYICYDADWCTGQGSYNSFDSFRWLETKKTLYDPCPIGYRVPKGGENNIWQTAYVDHSEYTSRGTNWNLANNNEKAWYPAIGFRNGKDGVLNEVGNCGYYWSSSHVKNAMASYFKLDYSFYKWATSFDGNLNKSIGCAVRCVRE